MAKNITLMGANYPGVPAVQLPQTGGGEALFLDADDIKAIDILHVSETVIPDNSDIHTYTTPGVYTISSDASAATMTNLPAAASGKLIVMARQNSSYIVQIYIPSTSTIAMYATFYNGSTWTAWDMVWGQKSTTVAHNGTSGTMYLKRSGSLRILNFDDVKASTSGISFTSALDQADRPYSNANGCLFVNTGKVALVWVNTSGNLSSSGVLTNDVLNGSLAWTVS